MYFFEKKKKWMQCDITCVVHLRFDQFYKRALSYFTWLYWNFAHKCVVVPPRWCLWVILDFTALLWTARFSTGAALKRLLLSTGSSAHLILIVHAVKVHRVFPSPMNPPYPGFVNSESFSLQTAVPVPLGDWTFPISSRALARESRSPESWCWASHRLRITEDGLSWHAK